MTKPIQPQVNPIPPDLHRDLPNPVLPWGISENIFGQMRAQEATPYKKVQVLPTDPEWRLVWRLFHHDKPHRYGIGRIYCVHERHQQQTFELNLSSIERETETFPPTWTLEPHVAERAVAIDRWKGATQIFSPFQTMESDGRKRTWTHTKVLPLWHGSSKTVCDSVCKSGFTFFGKTSIGSAGGPKSTDEGFFGSGIYFTNSARYAADIYGEGQLLFAWVSMREPFPVVGDPTQTDMQVLKGKGAYKDYNAHYVPVSSVDPSNPYEALYYPTQRGQIPHCDEIVVFHKSQALPRFWVELTVETPYLMSPTDIPQFVNELIPHLLKLLQNPHVDRDQKLRNCLGRELGFLLTLQEDDYLEDRHATLYQQLTQLIDTQGKVVRQVSRLLTGTQPAALAPVPSVPQSAPSPAPAPSLAVPKPAPAPTTPLPPPTTAPLVVPSPTPPPKPSPKPVAPVAAVPQPPLVTMPAIAFGKEKWAQYFGDVGVEPPLPSNIGQILSSPCIFWPGKRVEETHLLVLIPSAVNGRPFCLDSLEKLIQSPKAGHTTKYNYYSDDVKKELGTQSMPSHWVLMTKDVIPKSREKFYEAQKALVQTYAQRNELPYELPMALEAATAILMEYVQTGTRFYYSDSPLTYTRCQEKVDKGRWPAAIGGLSSGGLRVLYNYDRNSYYHYHFSGVAGLRKLGL